MTDAPPQPDHNGKGPRGELADDRYLGTRDLTHWYTPAGRLLARQTDRVTTRLGPNAALVITLVVGVLIAILLSVAGAQVYDAVTESDGVSGLDQPLLNYAITLRSPLVDSVATGYTDIAGPIGMPIVAVVALLILAIHRRSLTPVILIVAAGGGSVLMTIAGKDLIGRVRPPLADAVPPYEYSPSFPSGHTLNALVVAGIIAYLLILRRHSTHARVLLIVAAGFFALTVGLSRVFLGHHWFTDVLAGWVLGAAWLALVITAHRLYLTTRRLRAHHAAAGTDPTAPGTDSSESPAEADPTR
ncbi:phosphatase PAP2 family protein [Subtercola boreus]|uniref:Phosphatidic acid phosphatase n=1 Tax=Subtercola boreus TaxID=120213 RepID=A0A3E0WE83_9MICO|nr:phosphatase PAP2 family protein [Subtercola boreus]RFA23548.1 phosphatidic acid phosphatase [Subtercola boreus]RFA23942.1 phosphatidic acid phosphatase [Subtercola boreus]RFA29640.1 phosphatidic acid phosphatase [Subtercola boreus]